MPVCIKLFDVLPGLSDVCMCVVCGLQSLPESLRVGSDCIAKARELERVSRTIISSGLTYSLRRASCAACLPPAALTDTRAAQNPRDGQGRSIASHAPLKGRFRLTNDWHWLYKQNTQMENLKQQYEYWLTRKNEEITKFVQDFNE